MREPPLIAVENNEKGTQALFEITTVFAAAGDNLVSFDAEIHPLAKNLVSLFIYDEAGKVYLLQRFNVKDGKEGDMWYDLPGGKIDPGETVGAAAWREAHEELGIDVLAMEQICQSYLPPCDRYPNGLVKYFIHVKDYVGVPENVLGESEGHLSALSYDLKEASRLLDTRLCPVSKMHLVGSEEPLRVSLSANPV